MKKNPSGAPVQTGPVALGNRPEVALVPLARFHPTPWNPRTISEERLQNLCRSLEADPEFLWRRPVLANL